MSKVVAPHIHPLFQKAVGIKSIRTVLHLAPLFFAVSDEKAFLLNVNLPKFLSAMSEVLRLKKLVSAIDDKMDATDPAELLDAGHVFLSSHVACEFLQNTKFFPPAYFEILETLDTKGLLTYHQGIAYSNLLAMISQDKARMEHDYQATRFPGTRLALAELNMNISEVYASMLVSIMRSAPAPFRKGDIVNLNRVRALYPQACQMARADQIRNDHEDIRIDVASEVQHGVVPSNVVLAYAYMYGADLLQLHDFYRQSIKNPAPWPRTQLPQWLKTGLARSEQAFYQEAMKVDNILARTLMLARWQETRANGIPAGLSYMLASRNFEAIYQKPTGSLRL